MRNEAPGVQYTIHNNIFLNTPNKNDINIFKNIPKAKIMS